MARDDLADDVVRVVAVSDSDSYLKWGAATLEAMPDRWHTEQWLIRNPVGPSSEQIRAATTRPVRSLGLAGIAAALAAEPPDVLLLAATGPVVQTLLALPPLRRSRRPVLVTGLPGISIPATERAVEFRSGCDLFVLHSHREVTEFTQTAHASGLPMEFGLATLPFIKQVRRDAGDSSAAGSPDGSPTGKIVFAAQAKVPAGPEERQRVLRSLAALPPKRRAVIKLRALPGEKQTHREQFPYPELWQDLVRTEGYAPDLIEFAAGSMADVLDHADALVTVSSTAALEAIGLGLPVLIIDDFGVSAEVINEVFIGSGCLGSLDDFADSALHTPEPEWLHQNYFHDPADDDWVGRIERLLDVRRRSGLPAPAVRPVDGRAGQARRAVRLVLPRPVLAATGRADRMIKKVRRRAARSGVSGTRVNS
jgi:hypothetical protein